MSGKHLIETSSQPHEGGHINLFNRNYQGKENCKRKKRITSTYSDRSLCPFPSSQTPVLTNSCQIPDLPSTLCEFCLSSRFHLWRTHTGEAKQLWCIIPCYRKEICTRQNFLKKRELKAVFIFVIFLTCFVIGREIGWVRTSTLGILHK